MKKLSVLAALLNKNPKQSIALWTATGWGLVLFVIYLSVTSAPPSAAHFAGDHFGHLLAYMTLMWWFVQLYPKERYLALAIIFIIMGGVLEVIQGMMGVRTQDILDVAANIAGVGFGWWINKWHCPFLPSHAKS